MSKNFKTDHEYDLIDKLKHENKSLKKQLKAARKLLDRYQVAEQMGLFDGEKILPSKKRRKEKDLYEQWQCFDCQRGHLKIIRIGNRYFRKCTHCGKHTKSQIWDDSVGGIK